MNRCCRYILDLILCFIVVCLIAVPAGLAKPLDEPVYADVYMYELKDGMLTDYDDFHRLIGLHYAVGNMDIKVTTFNNTVKCDYSGTDTSTWSETDSLGHREYPATIKVKLTMYGDYTSKGGMSGHYTYDCDYTVTGRKAGTETIFISLKGSFIGPGGLATGPYTITFGPGTGIMTDEKGDKSDFSVKSWAAGFQVYESLRDSGTRFSGITGVVEILLPQDAPRGWKAAKLDMVLPVGTHIRTEDDSACVMSFADLSTFVLESNGEIVLKSPPDKDSDVQLIQGSMWTNLKKMFKEGSMEIEMNQAVAGIKGTTLVCEETGSKSTVKVLAGDVTVTSKTTGKQVNLAAGKMVSATSAGLGHVAGFNVNQEQAKWQALAPASAKGLVTLGSATTQSHTPSNSDSQAGGTKKKIRIGPLSCFIATAAYGSETAAELDTLRAFRDRVLLTNMPGELLVDTYYACSPPLSEIIANNGLLRAMVRIYLLDPVVVLLKSTQPAWNK
ncbi:MAG: FecR family protein [Dehalococcoidia bacterium]